MSAASEIWDEKSKNYPKFNGDLNEMQKNAIEILSHFGCDFNDKILIDIGAGTGLYSLYFTKFCKFVTACDISKDMLEILKNSAKKFKISNVNTILGEFSKLTFKQHFDIAFLSMSPALQNEDDFEKFCDLADNHIYINWQNPRKSSLLANFINPQKRNPYKTTQKFTEFLDKKNINFKSEIYKETFTRKRSLQAAFENVSWHLKINEIKINKNEISKTLQNLVDEYGEIKDKIETCIKVIVY